MNKPKFVSREYFVKLVDEKINHLAHTMANMNMPLLGKEITIADTKNAIIEEYDVHTGYASTSVEDVEDMMPEDLLFVKGRKAKKK